MTSSDSFTPGPILPVALGHTGPTWILTLTRDFPHPPAAVWSALTDPEQLAAWAPYTADHELGRTGPAALTMAGGQPGGCLDGTVTTVDPPRLLEHAWGSSRLRWELCEIEGGTRLSLQQSLDEASAAPGAAGGWHICLAVAGRFLDGAATGRIVGQAALDHGFEALRNAYGDSLGLT